MKTIFRYSEEQRKIIWDELSKCEYTLKNLKSIIQNEGEISSNDWYEWVQIKKDLFCRLNEIQQRLKIYNGIIRYE